MMNKLKPEDIVWKWDWPDYGRTADCPFCHDTDGGHWNGCFCPIKISGEEPPCIKNGFWEACEECRDLGLMPDKPSKEDIQGYIDWIIEAYKEKKRNPFGEILTEENYFYIKKWAKKANMPVPTFEELCETVGQEPIYNCKTGREYQNGSLDIKIISFDSWESEEDFENERITWPEYCERRHHSECDYSVCAEKRWRSSSKELLSEASIGQRVHIWSGKCFSKKATVLEHMNNNLTKVLIDGTEDEAITASTNKVRILYPLEYYYEIIESYGYKKEGNIFINDKNQIIDLDAKTFKRSDTEKWEYNKQEIEDILFQICEHLPYDKKYSN